MVTGEKRNSEEERMMEKVTAILLDIEGTTTSISFVKVKVNYFKACLSRPVTTGDAETFFFLDKLLRSKQYR